MTYSQALQFARKELFENNGLKLVRNEATIISHDDKEVQAAIVYNKLAELSNLISKFENNS